MRGYKHLLIMKIFTSRILTVILIGSLSFMHVPFAFADDTEQASTTETETVISIPEEEPVDEALSLATSTPLVFTATSSDPVIEIAT
ncbi:MAG: hypothetical protein K0S38_1068, partial [Candidatus Paceibacter sp.]|nr:hypothetical protein [Candidatus Paceibacter sp.]